MKHVIALAAVVCLGFTSLPAAAQTNAEAQSSSSASQSFSGQSASIAASSGNQVLIDQRGPATTTSNVRNSGSTTARIESAPSLGGLALGGGHPCAFSKATGQISVIGGGAGFGGMQIDSACMLLINAVAAGDERAYNAAMMMIAGRDPNACKAMYMAGMVADCVDKRGKSTVKAEAKPIAASSRNAAPTPAAPKLWHSCRYDEAKNQVMIRYTSAGRKDKTGTAIACQRSLGF